MNKFPIPITLTEIAAQKISEQLKEKPEYNAIRVSVNSKGCNGFSYVFEYATQKEEFEDVFQQDDITLYIDPKASMFLFGTEIDYEETLMQSGFKFNNPLSKSVCGCGESFSV